MWSIPSAAQLRGSLTAPAARPTSGRSLPAPAALAWADASGDVRKANSWAQRGLTMFLLRVGISPVRGRGPLLFSRKVDGVGLVFKFDAKNTNVRSAPFLQDQALPRAGGLL